MKIEEFEEFAKKAGLSKDEIETFKAIESLFEGSINDLNDYLQAEILANENQTPFIMPSEEVQGEINFALTQDNQKVGINQDEPHMLIAGMTKAGKTTLLLRIFTEILNQEK